MPFYRSILPGSELGIGRGIPIMSREGSQAKPMTTQGMEKLIGRYVATLSLDANVIMHSFPLTALTAIGECGIIAIDMWDFGGHTDPGSTLTQIGSRHSLSHNQANVLR